MPMRLLAAPLLLALALALAPAAGACHPGLRVGAVGGVVFTPGGPALAYLDLWSSPLCEGATTVTIEHYTVLGGGVERFAAVLDIVAPDVDCIGLGCGGSDPLAAALRLTGAGLDLAGGFTYPHATAGFALAGTVHGLPAAFFASAV